MRDGHWVGTWSQALSDLNVFQQQLERQTVRAVVRVSLGGDVVRVRLSNRYGRAPLVIGAAHIALAGEGASIQPTSTRALTFEQQPTLTLLSGREAVSDPAHLDVPTLSQVVISFYLRHAVPLGTGNLNLGGSVVYASPPGDFAAAAEWPRVPMPPLEVAPGLVATQPLPFVAGMDVLAPASAAAIVAFGDSITAFGWPDILAERLQMAGLDTLSVLNQGIAGNRVVHDGAERFGPVWGRAGSARFEQDALEQPGVRYVLVLEGANDLGHPGIFAPTTEEVTAEEIIAGLRFCVEKARARGVKIIGGTVLPFEGSLFWTPEREQKREAVNAWIRTAGSFDGVFDADAATRDPASPTQLLAPYDSGDHAHPSLNGLRAIAESVDLELFHRN